MERQGPEANKTGKPEKAAETEETEKTEMEETETKKRNENLRRSLALRFPVEYYKNVMLPADDGQRTG